MLPDRLASQTVTLTTYGAQVTDPATFLPSWTGTPSTVTMQSEPWRPDASPPRPEGQTSHTTRLFVSRVEVRCVEDEGEATTSRGDRITDAAGVVWQVVEVVVAPRLGPIPAAWHAYCIRVEAPDEPAGVSP